MKYLHVRFSDATYRIPAEVIAKDRATYYANQDVQPQDPDATGEKWNEVYEEELKITLEDDSELLDWASNNIDWDDISEYAERVEKIVTQPDYRKEWTNAKKTVKGK